jgi:hypothetical protein
MNFKTTLVLLLLVLGGGVFFLFGNDLSRSLSPMHSTATVDQGTLDFLEHQMTAEHLTKIDIKRGDHHVVLSRTPGGEWSLPGQWPARKAEVGELVALLTNLKSRFVQIPGQSVPSSSEPPIEIVVHTADGEHRITLVEEAGQTNRFARATYLRLDDKDEVVRLGPGLIAALDKPQDYYQQRRLFAADRVAKDNDSTEKIERLAAKALTAKAGTIGYTLTKAGDDWDLSGPVHDHTDPDKLKTILTAVPDIWAERFYNDAKKGLADYGLDKPEQTLQVTRENGATVNLLIGKESQVKTRTVMRPAPNFGGPPMPPQREVIHEPYRFAKLQDNDQVFEIRADKLKDVFVAGETLRDPRIARFRSDDARRVELERAGQTISLVKDKDHWRVEKPWQADGEASKILELLDRVSSLQALDKDVIDKGDPKAYGLDKPYAKLALTIEEERKTGETKTKQTRNLAIALGKREADKSKLYLQVAGLDRINAVDDSLLKLVERPALAFRSRRVLDFPSSDAAKVEVRQGAQGFTLEQSKGTWRLSSPTSAELDGFKGGQLAGDLGRLEVVEFAAESAPAAELEKTYGLDKPALEATVSFNDAKKPAQTLQIGKQVAGKPEYYAKLASTPSVFVVKKEIRDALEKDSLSYRPSQLLQLSPEAISELRITKSGPEYRLSRQGAEWKIQGPFEATVPTSQVKTITDELTNLRSERYAAHSAKDLAAYGLDKPYLRVVLREEAASEAKDAKEKPAAKERVLLLGKPTDKDSKTRFAKLGDSDAVFVVNEKTLAALDHEALDLLDRNLLNLDTKAISRIRGEGAIGPLTLERQGQEWKVLDTPASPFSADQDTAAKAIGAWANIRASRFAAFGPKVDWPAFGLDKPENTVKVTVTPAASTKEKVAEHTLAIGKKIDGAEHFARLDNAPCVVVLPAAVVADLTHGYLDFVNRQALKLNPAAVTELQRKSGNETLEFKRKDAEWRMVKPRDLRADGQTLDILIDQLGALRGDKVAAYPAKDLKTYGLDAPEVVLTLRTSEAGKTLDHTIKLGKKVGSGTTPDDRFAVIDDTKTVFVLPASLTSRLTSAPLQFQDKNLARFGDADKIVLERGPRKAVFAKVDGQWKLTEPLDGAVELTDLEEFAAAAARLRADEIVAEKPADLKLYGFDKPTSIWRFFVGNKEALSLQVGNVQKGNAGLRHYGKIAGSDLVFLMTPEFTTKALAEYRNRTIWPALDAVGIDRLSYRSTEHPFVLAKPENDWVVEGKPGLKVRTDAIRETLDALASLKAESYVLDKANDLKLFGLEPPQLAIEIQTKSGKRMLHIGRQSEGTKRYYARVPDNEVSPVFLLGEADGGKIVRQLSGFTRTGAASAPAH